MIDGKPRDTILSCTEFAALHVREQWVVLDCRHDPRDIRAGWRAYQHSRLPDAQYVHAQQDMSGSPSHFRGRHPLPHPHDFVRKLEAWGIDEKKSVLIYDDSGSTYAARLWWMLRWVGHKKAQVLDGGWHQWRREQHPIEYGTPKAQPAPARFYLEEQEQAYVDLESVLQHLHSPERCLIDARPAARYLGLDEPWDPVAGHIPGALNRPFRHNLDARGCFLSPARLRAIFIHLIGDLPPSQVIHQCGAGITACNNLLAMEIARLSGSKLYPGSWSEWCADPERPMARWTWSQNVDLSPVVKQRQKHLRN